MWKERKRHEINERAQRTPMIWDEHLFKWFLFLYLILCVFGLFHLKDDFAWQCEFVPVRCCVYASQLSIRSFSQEILKSARSHTFASTGKVEERNKYTRIQCDSIFSDTNIAVSSGTIFLWYSHTSDSILPAENSPSLHKECSKFSFIKTVHQ